MSCLVSPLGLSLNGKVPVLKYPPALLRAYTLYIVCVNCLHSFTDGGEGLKIRGIGVKAKVKEKSEDIEVKSKGRKGNQAVVRCFSVGGEGSEGKKREIIV